MEIQKKKSLYKSNNLEVSICQFWYDNPYFSAQPEISLTSLQE